MGGLADRIRRNVTLPAGNRMANGHPSAKISRENALLPVVFGATLVFMLIAMPWLSRFAGISGDEEVHYGQAQKVYQYIITMGKDKACLDDPHFKLNYYGQSFDFLTYCFNAVFHVKKVYETRHFFISLVGFLAIVFTGLLARHFAGYGAGLIAMILMFCSPAFLGHSLNNSIDVPFAFGFVFSIFFIIKFLRKLPEFSLSSAVFIVLGIGWTISIRIAGLVLIGYLWLLACLYLGFPAMGRKTFSRQHGPMLVKCAAWLGVISTLAYFVGLITWPYAWQAPLRNPIRALHLMSKVQSFPVLFEGKVAWSNELPWYYIPKLMLISVPVIVLLGLGAFLVLSVRLSRRVSPLWTSFLVFAIVFPVALAIYNHSNFYNRWRHFLFIYPPMVVLAALGLHELIVALKKKPYQYIGVALCLLALYHPVRHIVVNTQNIYVYFNELVGGVNHVVGNYETDYFFNSVRHGCDWLLANVIRGKVAKGERKILVGSNGWPLYFFRNDKDVARAFWMKYYRRGEFDWDYAVIFCNFISPYQLKNKIWPPKGTIHTIDVDQVAVCAIVQRLDKSDYLGYEAARRGMYGDAVTLFRRALEKDPNNESALTGLVKSYLQMKEYDPAIDTANLCLERVYPEWDKMLALLGQAYLRKGDFVRAEETLAHARSICSADTEPR
jgi:hypothetical protein